MKNLCARARASSTVCLSMWEKVLRTIYARAHCSSHCIESLNIVMSIAWTAGTWEKFFALNLCSLYNFWMLWCRCPVRTMIILYNIISIEQCHWLTFYHIKFYDNWQLSLFCSIVDFLESSIFKCSNFEHSWWVLKNSLTKLVRIAKKKIPVCFVLILSKDCVGKVKENDEH